MFKLLIGKDAGEIKITGPYRPEGLIHRTSDGTAVRSKSEVIVYDILSALGLTVEYETPLVSKSGDPKDFRLPDFTVHYQGKTWYWEHLGMLDKESYKRDWELKRDWYRDNGYWDRVVTSQDRPGGLGGVVYADKIQAIALKPHSDLRLGTSSIIVMDSDSLPEISGSCRVRNTYATRLHLTNVSTGSKNGLRLTARASTSSIPGRGGKSEVRTRATNWSSVGPLVQESERRPHNERYGPDSRSIG